MRVSVGRSSVGSDLAKNPTKPEFNKSKESEFPFPVHSNIKISKIAFDFLQPVLAIVLINAVHDMFINTDSKKKVLILVIFKLSPAFNYLEHENLFGTLEDLLLWSSFKIDLNFN